MGWRIGASLDSLAGATPGEQGREVKTQHAASPPDRPLGRLADELGELFTDEQFVDRFLTHGQLGLAPWRVALVTILQFAEGLSNRQAAQALRSRIGWKYVLRLALDDGGFDASVLSESRGRLLAHDAALRLFDTLLAWCRERGFVKAAERVVGVGLGTIREAVPGVSLAGQQK